MTIETFNTLDRDSAAKELFSCCGSDTWVNAVMEAFPFASAKALVDRAISVWYDDCRQSDWLQAFGHHPEIGDIKSLEQKFAGNEQAGIKSASPATIEALAAANQAYKTKFGFIFIVCATGKPADEMLQLLQERLKHTAAEEEAIAMGEQMKITLIRFKKLFEATDWSFLPVSQLTTHVLDTSLGKPGQSICIRLLATVAGSWQAIAIGQTNSDGRIADLLPPAKLLPPGEYKLCFDTAAYFATQGVKSFYPEVTIQFRVFDDSHYHVPLLLNPFGYSTYRGS